MTTGPDPTLVDTNILVFSLTELQRALRHDSQKHFQGCRS
jgi:hypothetical protein